MLQGVVAPQSISEVGRALASGAGAKVLAGGTMVMPVINSGIHDISTLVSLRRLGLSGISRDGNLITIGATTPISHLQRSAELAFLHSAIDSIASPTVRNMATVGGNLFVEQPYGDLAVCLIALGASAAIVGPTGHRAAPVEEVASVGVGFGEIVTAVVFQLPAAGSFRYRKASRRALNSASIVTVAARIEMAGGTVSGCRIALGGVAPRPVRAKSVEAALQGRPFDRASVDAAAAAASADIEPFTDAYASAWYRARVTPVHIRRALLGE